MKLLSMILLCALGLLGQEPVSRVVQLKNIHPDNAQAVLNVLSANKVRFQADGNLRIVALHGPPELVEAMESALKKLDVPAAAAKNIELTFHMVLAGPQGDNGPMPPDLAPVVVQLRNIFGLKSFRLMETAVIRTREGRPAGTNGTMAPVAKVDQSASYEIACKSVSVSTTDKGANVRIDGLFFQAKLPNGPPGGGGIHYTDATIRTEIDVREGQKVVVGKSSIDNASQSIFLVVTAKAVD